ncbi:sigma-70 family RNA polymerase sigma factor [Fulvivirga aurantia]|uniref:sigma-70 family RNA polymerase sigma factor n=1 Tax=Fulvivirga aurantia TaxID=2529383 RepID=UPI00162A8753
MNQADDDNRLIDQILEGQQAPFNQLVLKYQNYAFTIAVNILKNEQDAEEVTHDAFVKAYKNLNSFNRTAKFSTWLYRIVFNTAISLNRKTKIIKRPLDEVSKFIATDSSQLEHEDQRRYINEGLKTLCKEDRAVITLFYLKENSIEEIAEITGQKTSTVKVRLHRARKRLAMALKDTLKEEALTL